MRVIAFASIDLDAGFKRSIASRRSPKSVYSTLRVFQDQSTLIAPADRSGGCRFGANTA